VVGFAIDSATVKFLADDCLDESAPVTVIPSALPRCSTAQRVALARTIDVAARLMLPAAALTAPVNALVKAIQSAERPGRLACRPRSA
jgi:hypothetical protein